MDQPTENIKNTSLISLGTTLVPTLIISLVYFTIFLYLRRSQQRFYAPRTYLGSLKSWEHTEKLPSGWLNWITAFSKIPDTSVLQRQSLDAYLFLRFLKVTALIPLVGVVITWPILFPVYITGGNGGQQLDLLSIGNIDSSGNGFHKYYAPTFAGVPHIPLYASRISSRTVLFTSVPKDYQDENKLRKIFGRHVKRVWVTKDTTNIENLVQERDKVLYSLEAAEVKLIKLANNEKRKRSKISGEKKTNLENEAAPEEEIESGSLVARWVPEKKRPTHKLGLFGLLGLKVDTIKWSQKRLEALIPATNKAQAEYHEGKLPKSGSVFIEFVNQSAAQSAHQTLTHHYALQMSPKFIGITPGEIVWSSLSLSWWQRLIRKFIAISIVSALIIFWAIPVGFVGLISNVNYLKNYSALSWLDKIPNVIMGVITGLLPSVALAILMSLVPVVIRVLAKVSGKPTFSHVELFTQKVYFVFQVVQVFLVATVASAATALIKQAIDDPTSITSVLATKIPKASNFYISYFIVQGLTIASGVISQVVGFILFKILYKYFATTPRSLYTKWATLSSISWGSTLPVFTNIAVIGITYSCIAPLVLGVASIGMFLFYLAYRYNILFVTETTIDTKGLIYPYALQQLLTGVYLAEISLIGLFIISGGIGSIILMVVFLALTVIYHLSLKSALDPLLYNLPVSLLAAEEASNKQDNVEKPYPDEMKNENSNVANGSSPTPDVRRSFLSKLIASHIHSDHMTLRKLLPKIDIDLENLHEDSVADEAYLPPSVTAKPPCLWIPRDEIGISTEEVAANSSLIPITDEYFKIDENNNILWDCDASQSPLWRSKVNY